MLELILLELRHSGILLSRKGKGGGYFLAREPGCVSLGKILEVVEGFLAPIPELVRLLTYVATNAVMRTAMRFEW